MYECPACDTMIEGAELLHLQAKLKKSSFTVLSPAFQCSICHTVVMDTEQMNLFRREVADQYRRVNGMFTSEEIKSFRKKLKMNQIEFSKFVGISSASIKRWEIGFVQTKAHNQLLKKAMESVDYIEDKRPKWEKFLEKFCSTEGPKTDDEIIEFLERKRIYTGYDTSHAIEQLKKNMEIK